MGKRRKIRRKRKRRRSLLSRQKFVQKKLDDSSAMLKKFLSSPSRLVASQRILGFVSRMRYMKRLRQDDEACAAALATGHLLLFHRLEPLLLRRGTGSFSSPTLHYTGTRRAGGPNRVFG
ncbi:uncharacterized protein LOC144038723 [Vanacampus margaritifer]